MTEHLTQPSDHDLDVLPSAEARQEPPAQPAAPQVARVSSYRIVRALVALLALFALAVITLVLGVVGPNKWILISLTAGGIAGFVFGAIAMQILEPGPPQRSGSEAPSPWEQFLRELDRCRRYDLTFTLARLPAAGMREPARGRRPRREQLGSLCAALRPHLRSTDLTWIEGAFVYVMLPGIDREACVRLLSRIDARSPGLMPTSGVTYASFPADGLTGNALLEALDAQTPVEVAREGVA